MGFTRPREESHFIIKSQRNIVVKLISVLLTAIMWIYSLTIIYLFASGMFNHNDNYIAAIKMTLKITNQDIQSFVFISIILFIICVVTLLSWRNYNKYRFGSLNRRREPLHSTDEDMLNLGLMDGNTYYHLKNNRRVVFETNPIKELYDEEENSAV